MSADEVERAADVLRYAIWSWTGREGAPLPWAMLKPAEQQMWVARVMSLDAAFRRERGEEVPT